MNIKIKTPVAQEPFWHAVVSKQAPIINKAICRADVAQEYADKVEESYGDVADITVKQLFTADQLAARDAKWLEIVGPLLDELRDAVISLETISRLAGKPFCVNCNDGSREENYLRHFDQVRGYAASRAAVARSALSAITEE